jgi:hypothetical protein
MTSLRQAVEDYLAMRRALGFKLRLPAGMLREFAALAEAEHASHITTALAVRWATQPVGVQPAQWANRLGVVRRFARFQSASDPRTEVPPPRLLPYRYQRKPPTSIGTSRSGGCLRRQLGSARPPDCVRRATRP